jgi:hypothetical protein
LYYENLEDRLEYNRQVDNLGVEYVTNLLLVPIYAGKDEAIGVIASVNG